MSGQLRALRNRIRSVENTKKITRAMEMVAAAKLRRFQDMMSRSRPFTDGLEKLLRRLSRPEFAGLHPFIEKREEKKTALVVITSDTGLCGSYNNDLINMALQFIREREGRGAIHGALGRDKSRPYFIGVGKSGITAFKNAGFPCHADFTDLRASRVEEILVELRQALEKIYISGEVDAVYVVYSHFKTLTTYKAVTEKLLPLGLGESLAVNSEDKPEKTEKYIFEPSAEAIFKKLIPFFFESKIRTVFLEAIVSEQIARMTAMSQATKNAREMIDSLVLKRNKARQAAITKEIIEIVSGSQALKLK